MHLMFVMKRHFKEISKLFSLLMAVLGLSQCGDVDAGGDADDEMLCMYGTPTAEYSVKGKVTDQSGDAVKGVEVTVSVVHTNTSSVEFDNNVWPIGLTSTGSDGSYSLEKTTETASDKIQIDVKDIDGAQNGEYKDATLLISGVTFKGADGAWYHGKAEVSVPTIKLEEK